MPADKDPMQTGSSGKVFFLFGYNAFTARSLIQVAPARVTVMKVVLENLRKMLAMSCLFGACPCHALRPRHRSAIETEPWHLVTVGFEVRRQLNCLRNSGSLQRYRSCKDALRTFRQWAVRQGRELPKPAIPAICHLSPFSCRGFSQILSAHEFLRRTGATQHWRKRARWLPKKNSPDSRRSRGVGKHGR